MKKFLIILFMCMGLTSCYMTKTAGELGFRKEDCTECYVNGRFNQDLYFEKLDEKVKVKVTPKEYWSKYNREHLPIWSPMWLYYHPEYLRSH